MKGEAHKWEGVMVLWGKDGLRIERSPQVGGGQEETSGGLQDAEICKPK